MMGRHQRWDYRTADKVQDALRARGAHPAARAMEHQQVALQLALRVLARPAQRRRPCAH
ncbi:MAG: hypothetical protein ACJ8LG_06415 [Massilia sp.]